jgi:hypothetical protein
MLAAQEVPPRPSNAASVGRTLLLFGLAAAVFVMVFVAFTRRPVAAPQINAFTANPKTVTPGRGADLCVDAANTAVVEVFANGARVADGSKPCLRVYPAATTLYVAVGSAADGRQVQRSLTIAVAPPPAPRIGAFAVSPARVQAGQTARLCYAVTGAHELHIVPRVGELTRLRACQTVVLRDPHRYRYTLFATGEDGRTAVRHAQVQVVAAAPRRKRARPQPNSAMDAIRTRRAIYQFDATPRVVERGQATSLCVGVDRPARGFVTHVGALAPGITRCYRVAPMTTTVYRLYVALQRSTAVESVTVAVRPPARAINDDVGARRR